jgi:hypothetical protein
MPARELRSAREQARPALGLTIWPPVVAGRGPWLLEPSRASIHTTPCAFRQVRWSFPTTECLSCGVDAPRLWDATRLAVDIDQDQPVVLGVVVSLHVCPVCGRMFRAQPPFLRPRAIYTLRVVHKAVEAVYDDGLAMRCVPDRLARDFWVKPDEKMVRLWCRTSAADVDFAVEYQPWVVANFSGILCVDEVYQGDLALLLVIIRQHWMGIAWSATPCLRRRRKSTKHGQGVPRAPAGGARGGHH